MAMESTAVVDPSLDGSLGAESGHGKPANVSSASDVPDTVGSEVAPWLVIAGSVCGVRCRVVVGSRDRC